MKFLTARWMSDEVKNFEQNLQNESYFICNRYISLLEEGPISNEWSWSKWHPFISLIEMKHFRFGLEPTIKICSRTHNKVQMTRKCEDYFCFLDEVKMILEFQNESYFIWYWDNFHRRNSTQFQINIPVELTWADQVSGHAIIRLTNVPNNLQMNLLYDFWRMGLKSISQKPYLS